MAVRMSPKPSHKCSKEATMTDSLKLLSPAIGEPVTVNPATGQPPRWKMALDVERCIGCHACSVACKVENNVPLGRFRTKVYHWEHGKFPNVKRAFLPTLCMQCEDAPCLKPCPTKAINRLADGIVRIDPDKCDHDGSCETAARTRRSAAITTTWPTNAISVRSA
ncbi:MAG: hypothetical protein FJY56_11955 [Betaproteobacteria bacterium]|nr:hypothetical protein [Betaproteobacteria bacterium]